MMTLKILHNHLGYRSQDRKVAILEHDTPPVAQRFTVYRGLTTPVLHGVSTPVDSPWPNRYYSQMDFSSLTETGTYFIVVAGSTLPVQSAGFEISDHLYDNQLVSNLVHYFNSQRCSGIFDLADASCPVFGSDKRIDVHGGWYDASGDASKYLSHLSYANFMNPQQTPQLVWNLIDGRSRMVQQPIWLDERMIDEALYGADFLVRMLDPDGFFYMTVFDRWSKDVAQRELCSYTTQQGHKFASYQAGFRQGAGSAIAALARASQLPRDGEFTRSAYREAAEKAFGHLVKHNIEYLDDGQENFLDHYCALLAACELFAVTGNFEYGTEADVRATRIFASQHEAGWYWANDTMTRSYFHAAEAGLPHLALQRFLETRPNSAVALRARLALRQGLQHEIDISLKHTINPFQYPRQYVQMPGQTGTSQFFIPHQNESGYWWQGENARIASLASAALSALQYFGDDANFCRQLEQYGIAGLNWIFGYNPFDVCMMQGHGRNNPRYEAGFRNAPGGVCNGITAGLDDESDIDFRTPEQTDPSHSWRWSEQWIVHGAWLFHALAQLQKN